MRILVASAFEASSHWAHAINTVMMAQAFARQGHRVTVICHRAARGPVPSAQLAEVYGLSEPIRWIQLPRRFLHCKVDQHWRFALLALPAVVSVRPDLVFARNYIFPWLSSKIGITTVAESHAHPGNQTASFLHLIGATKHQSFRLLITISRVLAAHFQSLGVPQDKLIVLPDAVDLRLFRKRDDLPPSPYHKGGPNVAYVGHLYDYKGIPTILRTAARLPDIQFHLIGGWPDDIERNKKEAQHLRLRNLTFHGMRPHAEIPHFLWHADVLLLPPSQKHPSAAWSSPLKMGEYLASGTPVIASSIPALRECLTDQEVEFVPPDDPMALAESITQLLGNNARAAQLRANGLSKAQQLSYEQRAEKILRRCGLSN